MNFKLSCISWDEVHVKFNLFDPAGANCGQICIRTADVEAFIGRRNWQGMIQWNGLIPERWVKYEIS
jgi:hypothetical protein